LLVDDELVYPYCFKDYQVLESGPLRFSVQLNYNTTVVNGDSLTEHRIITLDKGSNFNKMTVWYDGFTSPVELATGVAVHQEDRNSVVLARDFVHYADPTDNVPVNNCQLFVATLFPNGITETTIKQFKKVVDGAVGHALGILDDYAGNPYTYYFGSAWSKFDVRTQAEWQQRIDWTMRNLRQPLKVEVK
jgi:hypothetical protein